MAISCIPSTMDLADNRMRTRVTPVHHLEQVCLDLSNYLSRVATRVLPMMGIAFFGYNTYLSVGSDKDPLESAFSMAVFSTFLLSTFSITYAYSLPPEESQKKKGRAMWVIVSLFALIAFAFMTRAWTILPPHVGWTVFASCALPLLAGLGFHSVRRSFRWAETSPYD